MLVPSLLLPSAFGLAWGMAKKECAQVLDAPSFTAPGSSAPSLRRYLQGEDYDIHFVFGLVAPYALESIYADVYESPDFFEPGDEGEDEAIAEEANDHYAALQAQYVALLGEPAFAGYDYDDGYPADQTAWQLSYWTHPEGRLQLELDQQDSEMPYVIRVSCHPPL